MAFGKGVDLFVSGGHDEEFRVIATVALQLSKSHYFMYLKP